MLYWSITRCLTRVVSDKTLDSFSFPLLTLFTVNEALRPKFLDLKEGACVISLKPFVSTVNARVTRRNVCLLSLTATIFFQKTNLLQVDDISAIFDVEERPYHPGSVSWGNSGGYYYLHRVDRQGYAKIKERFESLHGNSTRSTRSRR